MANSDLLEEIMRDYCEAYPETEKGALTHFCSYAADWFSTKGIVGLGHTAEGLALRLADGSEKLLFGTIVNYESGPSAPITGLASKIEKGTIDPTRSFPITGR